jgi:hypothetical protein
LGGALLVGFEQGFRIGSRMAYGMFDPEACTTLGEIGLYPRDANRRVPFAEADRVELGYLLRADLTGRGFVKRRVS